MAKADGFDLLKGHVGADEAQVGGQRSGGKRGRGGEGKTIVLGLTLRGVSLAMNRPQRTCCDRPPCLFVISTLMMVAMIPGGAIRSFC
jgi:hypothetical protein